MTYTFVTVNKQNYQVIKGLFSETNDWVEAPNEVWLDYILTASSAGAEIIECNGEPIGFVQLERNDEDACAIALYIAAEYRGRGHGPRALEAFTTAHTECNIFSALIEQDNLLSSSAFEKAGFRLQGPSKEPGVLEYRFARNS